MAVIKCKMCGGDLILEEESNVAECEYCGSRQTVPSADNEKKLNLFARANRLRANNEFDKASGVYESIVADFPEEAEAYWGLILCKYGIEYVDDPATGKKIPTCHRSSFESVMDDPNFELVMENADPIARRVYREEAKQIEELRKRIIEVSSHEEPYDIFICYKETTDDGQRTLDSVLAQDVYDMLTENGYRVFFSRVTLEDKLGVEYEPYIFAALNSAKIMLAFGTDYDYYNAVWVKNEWSRFLQLIAKGEKKTLIPCYKNIDAYDMPKEFAKLQAQDLGKVGAMQDLLRGIKKILPKEEKQAASAPQQVIVQQQAATGPTVDNLLRRGNIFLEERNWDSAKEYFNKVLDIDAENAEAYLGLMLTAKSEPNLDAFIQSLTNQFTEEKGQKQQACPPDEAKIAKLGKELAVDQYLTTDEIRELLSFDLSYSTREASAKENKRKALEQLSGSRYFTRAKQYAAGETKAKINRAEAKITAAYDRRIETAKQDAASTKQRVIAGYQAHLKEQEQAAQAKSSTAQNQRESDYNSACEAQRQATTGKEYLTVEQRFRSLQGYKDAAERANQCLQEAKQLQTIAEREAARKAKKKRNITIAAILAAALAVAAFLVVTKIIIPNSKYKAAVKLYEARKYQEAISAFEALDGYKDSTQRALDIRAEIIEKDNQEAYRHAEVQLALGMYDEAAEAFQQLEGYKDSAARAQEAIDAKTEWINRNRYEFAEKLLSEGKYQSAASSFEDLGSYQDSEERAKDAMYQYSEQLVSEGQYWDARNEYLSLGTYKDANDRAAALWAKITHRDTISAHGEIVAIKNDGTVIGSSYNVYGQLDAIKEWTDIVAVDTDARCIAGLRSDGTVVIAGETAHSSFLSWEHGIDKVKKWENIVAIAASTYFTVGLKDDGTVVAVGENASGQCNVENWKDIVAISTGASHTVGLKYDGSVVATGNQLQGQCRVGGWKDIIAIAAGDYYTVGLKTDGTVVATTYEGNNDHGQCDVSDWKNIVAIDAGYDITAGVKSNGTVVLAGRTGDSLKEEVSKWKNIVAVSVDDSWIVGLKADGSVVMARNNTSDKNSETLWKDIKVPD